MLSLSQRALLLLLVVAFLLPVQVVAFSLKHVRPPPRAPPPPTLPPVEMLLPLLMLLMQLLMFMLTFSLFCLSRLPPWRRTTLPPPPLLIIFALS